jgi:hypothetical protein
VRAALAASGEDDIPVVAAGEPGVVVEVLLAAVLGSFSASKRASTAASSISPKRLHRLLLEERRG